MLTKRLEIRWRESGSVEWPAERFEHNDELFGMRIRQGLEQDAVHDAEHSGVGANADRKRGNRNECKSGAPAEVPQAVPHILQEQIEMLAGRSREDAADGVTPQSQKRHRSSSGEYVLSVFAECLRHLVAEIAAELGRKEPQERAEESLGSRHGTPR
jgi:hypothetical protein